MTRTLTVVLDSGAWVVATEDLPVAYEHMEETTGPYEVDPSDNFDFHYPCGADYMHSEDTGRTFCRCGYWYERETWQDALR